MKPSGHSPSSFILPSRKRSERVELSLGRRLIVEHCHFSGKTTKGVMKREIDISVLLGVIADLKTNRPPWTLIFLKAYALIARDLSPLRQSYVILPWPHLSQVEASLGSIPITRDMGGEEILMMALFPHPEAMPLGELSSQLQAMKTKPIAEIASFRRALATAKLPLLFRRLAFWLALNVPRQRRRHFGTFAISNTGEAEIVYAVHPLTALLTFGQIPKPGTRTGTCVEITLSFDHRVFDGMMATRVLKEVEAALNGPIADELRSL
jgi:hypothetical protein